MKKYGERPEIYEISAATTQGVNELMLNRKSSPGAPEPPSYEEEVQYKYKLDDDSSAYDKS